MSTYTDASLIVTPNAYKAGKLYSLKPTDGTGDLDVVRATTATYVGSDGLIKTALANEPRIDYTNGSCPSILVEPQRTNLVFPSATATTQTRTVTAVAHTLSFYGTGSVVLSGVATGTLNGTGANNKVTLTFTPTAGSLILTVVGSVTNWQLEAGTNATSYIPTVASTVTRNADVISKTGISDLINSREGVLFANIKALSNPSTTISGFSLGLGANRISFRFSSTANQINAIIVTNSVQQVFSNYNSFNNYASEFNKIALKYKDNDVSLYINGVKVLEDLSCTMPNVNSISDLLFSDGGISASANSFFGNVNLLAVFPTVLSDAELIDLTTI